MFFRERNKTTTIDQVDFKQFERITNKSLLPYELDDCINNALENRDFNALKSIYDKSKKYPNTISLDRIVSQIYLWATSKNYSKSDFISLLNIIPHDINAPLYYVLSGMCTPPKDYNETLIHTAAGRHAKEIFDYLAKNGADLTTLSSRGKTLTEELESQIEWKSKSNTHYFKKALPEIKEMLETVKAGTDSSLVSDLSKGKPGV